MRPLEFIFTLYKFRYCRFICDFLDKVYIRSVYKIEARSKQRRINFSA